MKTPSLKLAAGWVLAIGAATPTWADCPWADDGALANALSDSQWSATSHIRYVVKGGSIQLDEGERSFGISIGPFLHTIQIDEAEISLSLEDTPLPSSHNVEIGPHRIVVPYPDIAGSPCAGAPLSMLLGQGRATLEGRQAELTVELWPASETRLVGMIRFERIDAFNEKRAHVETIEALREPL